MEKFRQYYTREEEFLEEFGNVASHAVKVLKGEWQPNYNASDSSRRNEEYYFSTGELNFLVVDSGTVYHDDKGFSSAQIVLKSSQRIVNVKVRKIGNEFIGETIVDKPFK
jgi:hypothetical protein